MIAFLQAKVWQLGTGVATAAALVLAISLALATANLHRVEKERDDVRASIEKPGTGWAARLGTCQANGEALIGRLDVQTAAVAALGQASATRIAEAEKGLAAARRDQSRAEAKVSALMKPLVGADTCLRMIEADERLMESLR
jgi:hypothetical protein